MNTGDLLTELRENILHDRSDQVAGVSDRLWSDETLMRYMNEAQRRFARHSLIIRDSTSDATKVTLVAGQDTYVLDPSVLAVISARYATDRVDLARSGHSALGTYRTPDPLFFDPSQLATLQPGKVLAYATDESVSTDDNDSVSVVTLKVYPAPDAAQAGAVIQMRIVRLPMEPLSLEALKATPEIPEDHHLDMLDWAAYLALRIVDHDGGDPQRAAEFRESFDANVKIARTIVMRKLFAPTPWGFGRNGFKWER